MLQIHTTKVESIVKPIKNINDNKHIYAHI